MKTYKIWDHVEKTFVMNTKTGTEENGYRDMKILKFKTKKEAEKWKKDFLDAGNYPDKPSTVLQIMNYLTRW